MELECDCFFLSMSFVYFIYIGTVQYWTRCRCLVGLSPPQIYPALYLYLNVIYVLKLYVNYIEVGNMARLSTKGEPIGVSQSTRGGVGGKNRLVTSVAQKHGTRTDRYSCQRLPYSCCPSRFPYNE